MQFFISLSQAPLENSTFLSAVLLTAGGTAMPCPLLSLAKTAALCAVLIFLLSPLAQVRWE